MELDFKEVAALINRAGLFKIDPQPVEESDKKRHPWGIYQGRVNVGTVSMKLYILYLTGRLSSREELALAIKSLQARMTDAVSGQIVYADSLVLNERIPSLSEVGNPDGIPRTGIQAFFISLAELQFRYYLDGIKALAVQNYVDPDLRMITEGDSDTRVDISRFLGRPSAASRAEPELNVLVAEPGQGKTYFCSYLAQRVARTGRIPFFVSSNQWTTMLPEELQSLWKTIVNALPYFNAPIRWAEGSEEDFVRVAQKSGAFMLIFDGFDEYVLRRGGAVSVREVLESFRDLAQATFSQILLTSRTAFWESGGAEVFAGFNEESFSASSFEILPFEGRHARRYFQHSFEGRAEEVDLALNVFDRLGQARAGQRLNLGGRGFLLPLIVELCQRSKIKALPGPVPTVIQKPLDWLCEMFCARENLRQTLGIDAQRQLALFEELAEAVAIESGACTDTLSLLVQTIGELDAERATHLTGIDGKKRGSLAFHPLLKQQPDHRWVFAQDQLYYLFAARRVLALLSSENPAALSNMLTKAHDLRQLHLEIAGYLLYLLYPLGIDRIKEIVAQLRDLETDLERDLAARPSIAASLAFMAVNERLPRGADKRERRHLLQELVGSGPITRLHIGDAVSNFDFRGVEFHQCRFENVTFIRCEFDRATRFSTCKFHSVSLLRSHGLGEATFTDNCVMDAEFRGVLALESASLTPQFYSEDDLRADLELALLTLLPSESRPPMPLSTQHMYQGRLGVSPLRREIMETLREFGVAESATHPAGEGFRLRDDAVPHVRFHRANGVFTGPLEQAWQGLRGRLEVVRADR